MSRQIIVLNVYGDECRFGKKLKEGCFRVKETGKILGKTEEDILCPEDIVTLAVSQSAGRKYVTDDMEYQVILNQADTKEQKKISSGTCGRDRKAVVRQACR